MNVGIDAIYLACRNLHIEFHTHQENCAVRITVGFCNREERTNARSNFFSYILSREFKCVIKRVSHIPSEIYYALLDKMGRTVPFSRYQDIESNLFKKS